jgi:hypothetical protein
VKEKMRTEFSWTRSEERRLTGNDMSRWEDNIKIDHKGKGWEDVDWIRLIVIVSVLYL